MIWFRLGKLALHLLTAITLFFFLASAVSKGSTPRCRRKRDPVTALAGLFRCGTVCLASRFHYATAYLNQRSMLMATLFAILTWRLFLEGLIRENARWLLASAATYLLAAFSKEHAIMTPAVSIALLFLVNGSSIRQRLMLIWPTLVLYGLIGFRLVVLRAV